jgi:hypothetical protein
LRQVKPVGGLVIILLTVVLTALFHLDAVSDSLFVGAGLMLLQAPNTPDQEQLQG